MSTGSMRRAQLISPFGVGAMSVLVNGTSVITAGLDHWYLAEDRSHLAPDEFKIDEWRLQERLGVKDLRLPPEFRAPRKGVPGQTNVKLTIPVLRFPRWSFCIYCKRLEFSTLSMSQLVRCPDVKHNDSKYKPVMSQVPFVAVCPRGHLEDFPFDRWVHRSLRPQCGGTLRLASHGGGTLAGQVVKCDGCRAQRTLEGILQATKSTDGQEHTQLTDQLAKGDKYECGGVRPWVADPGSGCGLPIRGALRGAGNVYFPKIESSIFLPRADSGVNAEVLELLRRPTIHTLLQLLREYVPDPSVQELRKKLPPELFAPVSDVDLKLGFDELFRPSTSETDNEADDREALTSNAAWRHAEFAILRQTPRHPDLTGTDPGVPHGLDKYVCRVRRIEVLRETRALRGFTRVRDGALRLSEGKALLRRRQLPPEHDWLPAYVVRGEGIYLELDPSALSTWEQREEVKNRANRIATTFGVAAETRGLEARPIDGRFVLVHTLAHLLINELVFTCGYSSASLRERLYVSREPGREMAGLLIYTAAGDSEGTMGGLVRMARPENLGAVIDMAVNKARWCSTDPVCMELGEAGQGPESCNLAACHGCALLPETSCEEFNRFLDRGMVIGTFATPSLGLFTR